MQVKTKNKKGTHAGTGILVDIASSPNPTKASIIGTTAAVTIHFVLFIGYYSITCSDFVNKIKIGEKEFRHPKY
jgi:hypothetical protein